MNYRRILIGVLTVLLSTGGTLMTVDYIDDYFNLRVKERIAIYFRTVVQRAGPIMYVYDNDMGWRLNPLTEYQRGEIGPLHGLAGLREYSQKLRVNSDGFIDRQHNESSPYYRIAFVGDSFVEAVQHAYTDRFHHLTEDYIFTKSNNEFAADIMNFGVSNWGPAHYFGAIKSKVLRYSPDEIWIFYFSGNDLGDSTPLHTQPPLGPTFIYEKGDKTKPIDIRFGFEHPPVVTHWRRAKEYGSFKYSNWMYEVFPFYFSQQSDSRFSLAWKHQEQSFDLIRKLVKKHEARLRLVYIPTLWEVNQLAWSEYVEAVSDYVELDQPLRQDLGEKRIKDLTESYGYEFISLTPLIREKGADVMYADHFSRLGHHWVANYLSELILRTSPLTKPDFH
ncbi:MAG: hypothetical protein P8N92_04970 [Burkholderiales bacterium]|nr:hypothetical protein [Burkholderiales bacterium]